MCSFISLNVIVHCAPMCKNRRGIPHDVDSQKGSNFLELLKSVEKLLPLENTYTELCWATPVQGLGDFYKKYGDFCGWAFGQFSLYSQKSHVSSPPLRSKQILCNVLFIIVPIESHGIDLK